MCFIHYSVCMLHETFLKKESQVLKARPVRQTDTDKCKGKVIPAMRATYLILHWSSKAPGNISDIKKKINRTTTARESRAVG